MNILLWVLQVLLALYYAMGGVYQLNTDKLSADWLSVLPAPAWMALGVFQIVLALGLVLPGVIRALPIITPIAAVCLIVETSLVAFRFTQYPGILWSVIPALLAAFVAYGRISLKPF